MPAPPRARRPDGKARSSSRPEPVPAPSSAPEAASAADRSPERRSRWRGKYAADWFHPNDLGYQDWTAAFLQALASP